MRTLYYIFERFGVFLFFILLEVVCFYLIVRFNKTQGLIWASSANQISGTIHSFSNRVGDFAKLDAVEDSLAEENARLRQKIATYENRTIRFQDSVVQEEFKQKYIYISAEVVKNSVNLRNNFITIDKGAKDSIIEHTGVISSKGVVGIVRKVRDRYSLVMSILNSQMIINAKIKGSGYFGPLVWEGNDPKKMHLNDIPKHADVQIQDTIQTTGYSSIFPSNIDIGVVSNVQRDDASNSHIIEVELFEDIANIEYVNVIKNLEKEEIKELEKGFGNE